MAPPGVNNSSASAMTLPDEEHDALIRSNLAVPDDQAESDEDDARSATSNDSRFEWDSSSSEVDALHDRDDSALASHDSEPLLDAVSQWDDDRVVDDVDEGASSFPAVDSWDHIRSFQSPRLRGASARSFTFPQPDEAFDFEVRRISRLSMSTSTSLLQIWATTYHCYVPFVLIW